MVPRVVEIHAGDASFLWGVRRKAVSSQKYRLRDLARADERVEAHLEGVEVAGGEGWAKLVDDLEIGLSEAIFAGSVWAMRMGDEGRFAAALDTAQDDRVKLDAVVSAFGWAWSGGTANDRPALPLTLVGPQDPALAAQVMEGNQRPADCWARRLLADGNASSRYVAIGAFAVCRVRPTDTEIDAMCMNEAHPPVVARAARMLGQIGIAQAVGTLEYLLGHPDAEVRQSAAWSMAVLHPQGRSHLPVLVAAAQDEQPNVDAVEMAARKLPADQVQGLARELASAGRVRTALIACAACGAPSLIDAILPHLAEPATARMAGFAFSQITGADLVKLDLELQSTAKATPSPGRQAQMTGAVEDTVDEAAPTAEEEADSHLPIPDPERVAEWWHNHGAEFSPTVRYLAGRPVTEPGLRQTMIDGTQPQRRAAAIELACLRRRGPVYNTSQPGFVQARDLLGWT